MSESRHTLLIKASQEAVSEGARLLKEGRLVVFPTDTVYGVGADAFNPVAVESLFAAKGRAGEKAIPLLISSPDLLSKAASELNWAATALASRFWPGGLTIVVPKATGIPDIVTGGSPNVAVRMPNHPVALDLISLAGGIVAATSANLSGQASPVTAGEAGQQLWGRVDLIIDGGRCPGGVASTVVDISQRPPRLVRSGAVDVDEIEAVLGEPLERG
ncbi:MAG: L-threonylcarbamoyladenylate synthase [Chloroflexi bacterium]|nr:L-threonylcarbamoyladenylate synthase [Chloroflexota bacterium]